MSGLYHQFVGTLSVEGSVATDEAAVATYHTIGPEHMEF